MFSMRQKAEVVAQVGLFKAKDCYILGLKDVACTGATVKYHQPISGKGSHHSSVHIPCHICLGLITDSNLV